MRPAVGVDYNTCSRVWEVAYLYGVPLFSEPKLEWWYGPKTCVSVGAEVNFLFEARMMNFSYNQEIEEFARQVLVHLELLQCFQVNRIYWTNFVDMKPIGTSGMKQADDLSQLRFGVLKICLLGGGVH